ncbi:MAG TPA: hypothetical protein VEB40_08710, partial [Flavipsychrobacter sp.]|nr:hypothetical protein [Flavipsychrobacter sp.]
MNEVGLSFEDLQTEWGLYYQDGGQGIKDLKKLLQQPSVTDTFFPLTPTKDTIIRKATVQMTRVLQAFQKEFTPMGLQTFKPREIPLYWMKIDSKLTPVELQQSWAGFLAEKGLNPEDMVA